LYTAPEKIPLRKDAVLLYRREDRDYPAIQRLRNLLEFGRDGALLVVEYGDDIPLGRSGRPALRKLVTHVAEKRGIEISYAATD
jgi:hypothetical protein